MASDPEVPTPRDATPPRSGSRSELKERRSWAVGVRPDIIGVLAFGLVIWILRRPHQLFHPYVWDEEFKILDNYLRFGTWRAVWSVPTGYLIMPVNLLVPLAAHLSFAQMPVLMYIMATGLFLMTLVMILIPDSEIGDLRTRILLVFALCLCPVNPEAFGVLLYGFWWATLWPIIMFGWKRDHWKLRAPCLVVAALSSPAGGALALIYMISYAVRRRRRDLISAAILLAGLAVEASLLMASPRGTDLRSAPKPAAIGEQILRTGGFFSTWWVSAPTYDRMFVAVVGAALFGWLGVEAWTRFRRTHELALLALFVAMAVFVVSAAIPVPLLTNPVEFGPRYYFLPFVGISWSLIYVGRTATIRHRQIAGILLLLASFGLTTTFSRGTGTVTAKLNWANELRKCARNPERTDVPIYFDGSMVYWHLSMTSQQCRHFVG